MTREVRLVSLLQCPYFITVLRPLHTGYLNLSIVLQWHLSRNCQMIIIQAIHCRGKRLPIIDPATHFIMTDEEEEATLND